MISTFEGAAIPKVREISQQYASVTVLKHQKGGGAGGVGSIRVRVPVATPETNGTKPAKAYKYVNVADNLIYLYCTLSKKGKEEVTFDTEYLEKEAEV